MPSHNHSASSSTSGGHDHYFYGSNNNDGSYNEGDGADLDNNGYMRKNNRYTSSWSGDHSHSISVANTGGNGLHENRQPYVVVNMWRRTA